MRGYEGTPIRKQQNFYYLINKYLRQHSPRGVGDLDGMPREYDTPIGPQLYINDLITCCWNKSVNKSIILGALAISVVPGRLTPKKITLAEPYWFTTTEYLYSQQVISLHEAWYKL